MSNQDNNHKQVYLFEDISLLKSANNILKREKEVIEKENSQFLNKITSLKDNIAKIDLDYIFNNENKEGKIQVASQLFKDNFELFIEEYENFESLFFNKQSTDFEDINLVLSQFSLFISNENMRIQPLELILENQEIKDNNNKNNNDIDTNNKDLSDLFVFNDNNREKSYLSELNLIKRDIPSIYKNFEWRAIIFSYLESLIAENQTYAIKQLAYNIYNSQEKLKLLNSLSQNKIKNEYEIEQVHFIPTVKLLILIANYLENSNKEEETVGCYIYLIKSFIYSRMFEVSLILYFQLRVCEFISNNIEKNIKDKEGVKTTFGKLFNLNDIDVSSDLLTEIYFKLINNKMFNFELLIAFCFSFDINFSLKFVFTNDDNNKSINNPCINKEFKMKEIEDVALNVSNSGITMNLLYELSFIQKKDKTTKLNKDLTNNKDEKNEVKDDMEEKNNDVNEGENDLKEEDNTNDFEGEEITNLLDSKTNKVELKAEEAIKINDSSNTNNTSSNNGNESNVNSSSLLKKEINFTDFSINNTTYKEVFITEINMSIFYPEDWLNQHIIMLSSFSNSYDDNLPYKSSKSTFVKNNNGNSSNENSNNTIRNNKDQNHKHEIANSNLVFEQGVCLLCKKLLEVENQNVLNCCMPCIEAVFNSEFLSRYLSFLNFAHKAYQDNSSDSIPEIYQRGKY